MRAYIVYDGRAMHDVDSASIMEYLGDYSSDKKAMRKAKRTWNEYDAVLVSYNMKGHDEIVVDRI